jgi:hypothetical protein
MADDREPDLTEDPRKQETSDVGLPETGPEAMTPDAEGAPGDRSGGDVDSDAPSPSSDEERDREQSTGNPHAAG